MTRKLYTPKRLVGLTLATVATLILAACGSGGAPVTEPEAELSQEDAQAFSQFATQSVSMQMDLLQNPVALVDLTGSSSLGAQGITLQQECVTEVGTNVDNDADGIPANGTWTYDCQEAEHGFTAQGTVTLSDDNDSDPDSGYLLAISEDFGFSYGTGSDSFSFGFGGTVDVGVSGNTYTADIDLVFEFAGGGDSASFAVDYSQTYVAAADGDADPFDNGTLTFSGTVTVSSDSGGTLEEYGLNVDTTTPLTISDTCTQGNVQSGAVAYSDTENNAVTVTYSSCDATATYNGAPI